MLALSLDEILAALDGLDPKTRQDVLAEAESLVGSSPLWLPNPGPQMQAYFSEADELFYGGQAGGGKSDLVLGTAVSAHHRSLVLRRTYAESKGLVSRMEEILGGRDGWNGQDKIWRVGEREIEIDGCLLEDDKQKFKGRPHDLIAFDEISDFTESQFDFITTWNRSTKPGQRCRVIAVGNPPTTAEGLWVLRRWAAWLDPTHPNPAKPGELRYYLRDEKGHEVEVPHRGPWPDPTRPGATVAAVSRTFIPARLEDNPDLAATNYGSKLANLPPELRDAYREGRFDLSLRDKPFQTIPTSWVVAAQARWTESPPNNIPMCAIGVDCSGGGTDPMVIAPRHDGWFARTIVIPGTDIPPERMGSYSGGLVIANRRDNALVIVDAGGGYGGPLYEHLSSNGIPVKRYIGSGSGPGRSADGLLEFANNRSKAIWRFREALNPDQPGGSTIALPPGQALVADLTAPSFEVVRGKIKVESKEDVVKRLGRSTNEGDAIVMAWTNGLKADNIQGGFKNFGRLREPKVLVAHAKARRR